MAIKVVCGACGAFLFTIEAEEERTEKSYCEPPCGTKEIVGIVKTTAYLEPSLPKSQVLIDIQNGRMALNQQTKPAGNRGTRRRNETTNKKKGGKPSNRNSLQQIPISQLLANSEVKRIIVLALETAKKKWIERIYPPAISDKEKAREDSKYFVEMKPKELRGLGNKPNEILNIPAVKEYIAMKLEGNEKLIRLIFGFEQAEEILREPLVH